MESINKYGIILRLITINDAEFIVRLWQNPLVKNFISQYIPTVDSQIEWIQNYKKREELGLDYYFIAQDYSYNSYGTVRLYNFDEISFELGSWIFMPHSPLGIAVKTHIIGMETGFKLSNGEYCKVTVRKGNHNVLKYLDNFKPIMLKQEGENIYLMLTKESFYNFKNRLSLFL